MRVPTRDYSGLQQAMQTAGQAKASLVGVKANSHTLQKFDLNTRRIDAEMEALSVQGNLAWANFGLGMTKTLWEAGTQVYQSVQDGRKLKAANGALDELEQLNQEEIANDGLKLERGKDGKWAFHEDEEYTSRRAAIMDALQEKYGLDDESLAEVRASLMDATVGARTRMQQSAIQRQQAEAVELWTSTTNDLADKYVAVHARDIVSGDWSGSDALKAQYYSSPHITDKDGAWEQAKTGLVARARKQVLGDMVDRLGVDEAYKTLKDWSLDADEDSQLREFVKQRKADHSAEVESAASAYAADVKAAVESGKDGASWSLGYESILNGYMNRPKEDQETARQAYLTAWASAGSTAVQQELGGSLFKTSKELEDAYKRLESSEMFRAMPADSRNVLLKPVLEAIEARKKDEKSVEKIASGQALELFNTTAADLSAKWEKGEIGTDTFVDGLKSTMDQIVGTGSVNAEDQLKMMDYTLKVVNRGVEDQVPEWLKPAWKTGWGAIEKSIQQTLGIKDLAKTMEKNPDLYADYMAYYQDAQKRLLGWIRTGGRKGQSFDLPGFTQEVEGIKTMLGSYFIDIQAKSGTGPDGLATGGLQNGQDFNQLLEDVASLPLDANGSVGFSGEDENATLRQLYTETGRRLDGRPVDAFSDEGPIHTEKRILHIDTEATPPMYATSPTGQTLQAFADRDSGDVYAADSAGNIYQAVSVDVKEGGKTHKEWRIVPGAVGTFEAHGMVGDQSTRMPDGTVSLGGALQEAADQYAGRKLDYNERAMLDNLHALDDAIKEGDIHRQELIIDELRRSTDDKVRQVVREWDDERKQKEKR
ncbi:MAG: hypothetical protein MR519_10710 [Spirochaetaceae bacterium]|nr:hypothetical protein [Spirochaetaceae bacterium]